MELTGGRWGGGTYRLCGSGMPNCRYLRSCTGNGCSRSDLRAIPNILLRSHLPRNEHFRGPYAMRRARISIAQSRYPSECVFFCLHMKWCCFLIPLWLYWREVYPKYLSVRILLPHLNRPDAGAGAYIEDALRVGQRGEVEVAAGEEHGDMMLEIDSFKLLLKDQVLATTS